MGKPKGFAVTVARDPEAHRELARRGGRAAHAAGTAHEFTSEEGRTAGRKGARASAESKARKRAESCTCDPHDGFGLLGGGYDPACKAHQASKETKS